MEKRWIKCTWPFEEISTRNCIFCKTKMFQGRARAYCSKGLPLTEIRCLGDPDYSISLKRVLATAHFTSKACGACPYFEHDQKEKESKRVFPRPLS